MFETGFVARKRTEEKRSAPGSRVYVTLESTNITNQVLEGLTDTTTATNRAKIIEDNKKELIEKFRETENEKSNPSIKKFFQKAKSFWKN